MRTYLPNHHATEPALRAEAGSGSYTTAWALLGIAVGVEIVGFFLNWSEWPWFDEIIHAFTFFAATVVVGLHLYGPVLRGYFPKFHR